MRPRRAILDASVGVFGSLGAWPHPAAVVQTDHAFSRYRRIAYASSRRRAGAVLKQFGRRSGRRVRAIRGLERHATHFQLGAWRRIRIDRFDNAAVVEGDVEVPWRLSERFPVATCIGKTPGAMRAAIAIPARCFAGRPSAKGRAVAHQREHLGSRCLSDPDAVDLVVRIGDIPNRRHVKTRGQRHGRYGHGHEPHRTRHTEHGALSQPAASI